MIPACLHDPAEVDALQQRHEQEQTGDCGAKRARGQIQPADIGDFGAFGLEAGGALLVEAAREAGEALFAQEDGEGIDADSVPSLRQVALNVIDGKVALAHRHYQLTNRISGRRRASAARGLAEEGGTLLRVMAELMAEDTETAGRVTEVPGSYGGREVFEKESTQRLVLAMQGLLGGEEEGGGLGIC